MATSATAALMGDPVPDRHERSDALKRLLPPPSRMTSAPLRERPLVIHDPRARTAYVRLSPARVAGSDEVAPGVFLDRDAHGALVGIELTGNDA